MSEDNLNPSHKGDKYSSICLSIVAIVLAAIALGVAIPRLLNKDCCGNIDLGIDYLGIIIGLLALMVTLMVAWNIWQTMEAKRSVERFEEKTNQYDKDLDAKVEAIKQTWLDEIKTAQDKTKSDIEETESYVRGFVASDVYHKLQHLHNLIHNVKHDEAISPFDDILYKFLYHSIKGLWYGTTKNFDPAYCKATLISMKKLVEFFPENSLNDDQRISIYAELEKIEPKVKSLKSYNEFMDIFKIKQSPI